MLNALPFLHYLPLTRRVYAYDCAGLCCMILCAAEERHLFNSVALYTIRLTLWKHAKIILWFLLWFCILCLQVTWKQITVFQWCTSPKIPPCHLSQSFGFIVVRNSLLNSFSVMQLSDSATLYLPLCYNQNTSGFSDSNHYQFVKAITKPGVMTW